MVCTDETGGGGRRAQRGWPLVLGDGEEVVLPNRQIERLRRHHPGGAVSDPGASWEADGARSPSSWLPQHCRCAQGGSAATGMTRADVPHVTEAFADLACGDASCGTTVSKRTFCDAAYSGFGRRAALEGLTWSVPVREGSLRAADRTRTRETGPQSGKQVRRPRRFPRAGTEASQ